MKKLNLILDNTNWLEATWIEEVVNQTEGEEDRIETKQLHCESYSGHPEHIAMLRTKALEFGTDLTEFETLIKQAEDAFIMPTQEELDKEATEQKIQEAKAYLASTDFKMTVDYYATLTTDEQTELTTKRAEARDYLKSQGL